MFFKNRKCQKKKKKKNEMKLTKKKIYHNET